MPDAGSDCCGTCWFNARNTGESAPGHVPGQHYCSIRELEIEEPHYTYCGNHPQRRPQRDPLPIGPVFLGDALGNREIWKPSPDSEEIRGHLLELLRGIQEQPGDEYPLGVHGDEIVVWQLGEFRERRAVDDLERIAAFDPEARSTGAVARTRHWLVELAREALAKIASPPGSA
jgi:hypothetical protein